MFERALTLNPQQAEAEQSENAQVPGSNALKIKKPGQMPRLFYLTIRWSDLRNAAAIYSFAVRSFFQPPATLNPTVLLAGIVIFGP